MKISTHHIISTINLLFSIHRKYFPCTETTHLNKCEKVHREYLFTSKIINSLRSSIFALILSSCTRSSAEGFVTALHSSHHCSSPHVPPAPAPNGQCSNRLSSASSTRSRSQFTLRLSTKTSRLIAFHNTPMLAPLT